MKKKIILQILCLLTTFGLSYPAYSWTSVYYVREDGSPTMPCGIHPSSPCSSIQTVLQNAVGDPLIKLARGAYTDGVYITGSNFSDVSISGGWDEGFSVQQCDPANTSISSNDDPLMSVDVSVAQDLTVTLACLSFMGTDITHRRGLDVRNDLGVATLNLEQVTLSSFAGSAITLAANAGNINVDIKKTTFQNNYQPAGLPPWSGAALYANSWAGGETIIHAENSLFHNNEANYGGAIYIVSGNSGSTTDLTLLNSTLSNNHALLASSNAGGGLYVGAHDGAATSSVIIINSIVHGNTNPSGDNDIATHAVDGGSSNVTARYSILGTGTYTDDGYNLSTDPLLDANYHLKDGSPAIDKAQCGFNSLIYKRVAPYDDIDGDQRPGYNKLSGCDIGADEHPGLLCLPIKSKSGKYAVICL